MEEENKIPTLYSFYNNQYDFNDLERSVYSGIDQHISTIKKGKKYEKEFREAVTNIMSGLKDGTITFGNGRFYDSRGRYNNNENRNKDIYGWAANYVYSNMGKSQKYVAPEDNTKIKWEGNSSIGRALSRDIFNSDNGNILDFIDLDPYDEGTNTRGTAERVARLSNSFLNVKNNFDSLFTGYTNADKLNAISLIDAAINAMQTNGFGDDDYLALSRAAGNLDFRRMFSTLLRTNLNTDDNSTSVPLLLGFVDWMLLNYPRFSGTLHSPISLKTDQTLDSDSLLRFKQSISNLSDNDLYRIIRSYVTDNNYVFNNESFIRNAFSYNPQISNQFGVTEILRNIKERGLLYPFDENNLNLFYIPMTDTKGQTAWVWDTRDNSLKEMSFHNIPYWRNRIQQEYNSYRGSGQESTSDFEQFLRLSGYLFKNGGVIKAESGVKFSNNANWYTGVFTPQLNHILLGLKKDSNYYTWLNNMQDKHNEIYRAAGNDWQNTAYKSSLVGDYQNLYKSGYNNEWGDNTIGYNSLGILNAQKQGMFDTSGSTRTSGDWAGDGKNWNTDNLYSAITDYRRLLGREGDYSPELLNYVTNLFKDAGYNFTLDENGYYKLNPISTSSTSTNTSTAGSSISPDFKINWNSGSSIYPIGGNDDEKSGGTSFGQVVSGILPEVIGAGRLYGSLRTNNKIAETLKKSIKPVLKDTYERYSPITGAFGEMLFRNQQAADLRRSAARPFTSDASLQLAGLLEADRQARELEYLGFSADDKEIKRTQEEALKRQEDNMARRSEVANDNREAMIKAEREKAQLEATRRKRNWKSVDNYLSNKESRLRSRFETDRNRRNNFRLQTNVSNIENKYLDSSLILSDYVKNWKAENPGKSITSMSNYGNYTKALLELDRWRTALIYKAYSDIYGYNYDNPYLLKDASLILGLYGFKKGGILLPRIMNLINNIIKNESHT